MIKKQENIIIMHHDHHDHDDDDDDDDDAGKQQVACSCYALVGSTSKVARGSTCTTWPGC